MRFAKLFLLLFSLGGLHSSHAQELNFTVSINAEVVQTTERAIFDEMKNAFQDFLNNQSWSSDNFNRTERIKANLILTIRDQPSVGQFTANVQIQFVRPVYGSSYETLLLNYADRDWQFQYTLSQRLQFNENSFTNNITALLSYYAFIALGLDYDSFSPLGGTDFYEQAQRIVNNAQNNGGVGWGQFQNRRNRYWLTENLFTNEQYEPVRLALYDYHINGLDRFQEDPESARLTILSTLENIQEVNSILPNAVLIRAFLDAKNQEITDIFSRGDMDIRRNAYNVMLKLDPARRSSYQEMVEK